MAEPEKYELKNGKVRWKITGVYLGINPKTGKQARTNLQGFKTKREANIALKRIEAQVAEGTYFEEEKNKTNYTFEEVYKKWDKEYKHTVADSTYLKTTSNFTNRILPEIGNFRLNQIKHDEIQNLVDKWKDFSNCKVWIREISRIYRYAIRHEYANNDPTEFVVVPKVKKTDKNTKLFYEKSELDLLLREINNINDPLIESYMRLLIFGGLRNGEVLGLRWSRVNFNKRLITIDQAVGRRKKGNTTELYIKEPKNEPSYRTISIDDKTIMKLNELKEITGTKGLVFKSRSGGILSDSKSRKWLKSLTENAGIDFVNVHGLRHTHASLLFEGGASIKYVMYRLGHNDIDTTMNIYTHVTKKTIEDFSEKFSDYFSGF